MNDVPCSFLKLTRKLRYIARKRNITVSFFQSQIFSEIFLSLLFLVQRRKDIPSTNVFKFLSLKIKHRWFEQGKRQAKLICVNVILMSDFYSDIRHFLRLAGISNTLPVSFSTNSWYRLKNQTASCEYSSIYLESNTP